MPFDDRIGANTDRKFDDVKKTLGIENLASSKVLSSDPDVDLLKEGQMRLVDDGSNFYMTVKRNGQLLKRAFTSTGLDTDIPTTQLISSGMVQMWSGTIASIPTGFLHCDGSAVSRTTYADLFSALGTIHGSGDGSTTFNLPDLRDKAIVGAKQDDSGVPKTNVSGSLTQSGGEATHVLTEGELASHTHTGPSHTHDYLKRASVRGNTAFAAGVQDWVQSITQPASSPSTGGTTDAGGTGATGSAGSGTAHNNLQPYYVLTFIIKT